MSEWLIVAVLYLVGSVLLIAELFLPAHGLIGLLGLGVIVFGLYETFAVTQIGGIISIVLLAILLPTGLITAVKNWHRTPIGRRISPPNPVLGGEDRLPTEQLTPLLGLVGKALTPLRPVGTCVFDGQREECSAEQGMIEADTEVQAIRLVDRTVSVRPVDPKDQDSATT